MILKNMGMALRFCIPQMIGRKVGEFWELIKPLVDFKYEVREVLQLCKDPDSTVLLKVIETRMNSMFELATQEEIDKLRSAAGSTSDGGEKSEESLELEDLDVCTK